MKKKTKKIDYAAKLKEALVDVDFDKKPEKVTWKELRESARRAHKHYNYEPHEASLRARANI